VLKVTLWRTIRVRVEFGDKMGALIHAGAFRAANDQRLEALSFAVRATAARTQDTRRGRPTNWTGAPISPPSVHGALRSPARCDPMKPTLPVISAL